MAIEPSLNWCLLPQSDQDGLLAVESFLSISDFETADFKWRSLSPAAQDSLLGQVQRYEITQELHNDVLYVYETASTLIKELLGSPNGELLRRVIRIYVTAIDELSGVTEVIVYCSILADKVRNAKPVDETTLGYLLAIIASRYAEMRDYSAAKNSLTQLQALLPNIELAQIHGSAHWVQAVISEHQGAFGDAIHSFSKAYELYMDASDPSLAETIRMNILMLSTANKNVHPSELEEYLNEARIFLAQHSQAKSPKRYAQWSHAYLQTLYNLERWGEVLDQAQHMLDVGIVNFEDLGFVKLMLAKAYWHLGNEDAASASCDQAVAELQLSTMSIPNRNYLRDAAQLSASMGDIHRAYEILLIATSPDPHLTRALDRAQNS